ncbi:MAG: DegV family protein [Alistipes sp.]|nr:DegV family protein [Alistipes sp.]
MSRVAIITDSNSGITQKEAKESGIFVIPMPFYIDGKLHFEDIDLTQEQFYEELARDVEISTSQPAVGDIQDLWDKVLQEYDQIVHIPMSSGLSGSCQSAQMLAADYEGKVFVVNNQRISVTQKLSVYEALQMAENGMGGEEIRNILEDKKFDSSIYITLDTLKYLKKGGRITPAAAALGTLLRIKPVLQIQGEKLDAFAKVRGVKQAKTTMINAIRKDCAERFEADESLDNIILMMAYTGDKDEINRFRDEVKAIYPTHQMMMDPLSLSVSCHIGPGAIAIACAKKLPMIDYSKISV